MLRLCDFNRIHRSDDPEEFRYAFATVLFK
jgi:hypothetical protein